MKSYKSYLHPTQQSIHDARKRTLRNEVQIMQDIAISSIDIRGVGGAGRAALHDIKKVKIFMQNIAHYSGGRYYAYMMARVMAMFGYHVEIITNLFPFFSVDFENFPITGSFKVTEDTEWSKKVIDKETDLVIGVPNYGGQYGHGFAVRNKIPFVGLIFETPNYITQWRTGMDATEEYWRGYAISLKEANLVICLAREPMRWAMDWFPLKEKPEVLFDYLYPAVNEFMIAKASAPKEREHSIVFVGRHTDFKQPVHIMKALTQVGNPKPIVHFIGQVGTGTRALLTRQGLEMDIDVRIHSLIPDEKKFEIIKRAKVLVTASRFEGFGIPPAEALWCGTPVVAYRLPVAEEAFQNFLDFVPVDSHMDMGKAINRLLRDKEYWEKRSAEGQEYAKKIFSLATMGKKIRQMFPQGQGVETMSLEPKVPVEVRTTPLPSVTAGIIVLNGAAVLPYSLGSVYDSVEKILIVEGAVKSYAENNPEMVNSFGGSVDDTLAVIDKFPDPDEKIVILAHSTTWESKQEMQNVIAEATPPGLFLKLDSDEVYHKHDLAQIFKEFMMDTALSIYRLGYYHFWHGALDQIVVDGVWDQPMSRVFRWREGWRWDSSFNEPVDGRGRPIKPPLYKVLSTVNQKFIYHLNYAAQPPEIIRAKINYYKTRGIEPRVKDTWSDWKPGQAEVSPTHGVGRVLPFEGVLPPELKGLAIHLKGLAEEGKTEALQEV